MPYDPTIPEEDLENRVARDAFGAFDCARIFGKVDFCVSPKVGGPTLWETEALLRAEAKKGVRADFAPLFAQLVLTVGGEKTFERHSLRHSPTPGGRCGGTTTRSRGRCQTPRSTTSGLSSRASSRTAT